MRNSFKKAERIPYFKRLQTKMSISFLIISILMAAILSTSTYIACRTIVTRTLSQKASSIAKATLDYIDVKEFEQLKTKDDEKKDSYIKMRESLSNIRKISGSKYVYSMRKADDGKFMYVVDGSEESELSHIGDTDASNNRYETVWNGKIYTDSTIRQEGQWGVLISSYYPLLDNGKVIGFVGVDYDASDMYAGFQKIKLFCILFSAIAALIIGFSGWVTSKYITTPLNKITRIAGKVSAGDLRAEKLAIQQEDELGLLSQSFNNMFNSIKQMVSKIQSTSLELTNSSKLITDSMQEIGSAGETVACSAQEIAAGSTNQALEAGRGFELVGNLSEKVESALKVVGNTVTNTNKMREENARGSAVINELGDDMTVYLNSALNVASKIEKLSEASKSIDNILGFITSIAEQTNLLALNAAIEAARAGEQGRGFAVVAEEVRLLSEQTTDSTKKIQNIVDVITDEISSISNETNDSKSLIYRVQDSLDKSKEAFSNIDASVTGTVNEISLLDNYMKEVDSLRLEVLETVEHIAAISQQAAAATEEISASSEEQNAAMEEVIASVKKLDEIIEGFAAVIKEYKL